MAYALIAGALAVMYVALIQEPAGLATRLGFKRRSAEWEFDSALSRSIETFNRVLAVGRETRPSGTAFDALRSEAEALVRELRALPPPTPEWGKLAAGYVRLMELHVESFGRAFTEGRLAEFEGRLATLTADRERLRAAYRERATRLFKWP